MPITAYTPTPTNFEATRATDRRASPAIGNSITATQWPVVTRAVFNALARGGRDSDPEVAAAIGRLNLRVKRLCMVKNALGQAMLYIDGSIRDHGPQAGGDKSVHDTKTYNRLRSMRAKLEAQWLAVPLEVRG